MTDGTRVQQLMPLMREFGTLERSRLGAGLDPLEYQRWLDLKIRIGKSFDRGKAKGASGQAEDDGQRRLTRLRISYKTRRALLDAIVDSVCPAGFFAPTPFAADVGTRFLVLVQLEAEGETAEVPCVVVTSISQGAHTLSTMSMGMSLKIERPSRRQVDGISRLFAGVLDQSLGLER